VFSVVDAILLHLVASLFFLRSVSCVMMPLIPPWKHPLSSKVCSNSTCVSCVGHSVQSIDLLPRISRHQMQQSSSSSPAQAAASSSISAPSGVYTILSASDASHGVPAPSDTDVIPSSAGSMTALPAPAAAGAVVAADGGAGAIASGDEVKRKPYDPWESTALLVSRL